MANNTYKPVFAPQLFIPNGTKNIDFYNKAFGAEELRRFSNDDGTVHVAEFSINGSLFHLHEDTERIKAFNPAKYNCTSVIIGLFVPDVDVVMKTALAAGAEQVSAAQDYEYGYRQGEVRDPFGHLWLIEQKI